MKELDITAVKENLPEVLGFVSSQLEEAGCGIKLMTQVEVAVEEIFVNISSYAYDPEVGPATIRVELTQEPLALVMSFIDHGKPYDPLAKIDPDVSLSAEDRDIGGLGIFITKKFMDDVVYEYKNGRNVLTLKKTVS